MVIKQMFKRGEGKGGLYRWNTEGNTRRRLLTVTVIGFEIVLDVLRQNTLAVEVVVWWGTWNYELKKQYSVINGWMHAYKDMCEDLDSDVDCIQSWNPDNQHWNK